MDPLDEVVVALPAPIGCEDEDVVEVDMMTYNIIASSIPVGINE